MMSEADAIKTVDQSKLGAEVARLLGELGVDPASRTGGTLAARSPITGEIVAHVRESDPDSARRAIDDADAAFLQWRMIPAPKR
ncbi:MAG TPA: aldehyde dehydrogenase family protein, partial [Bradyrhizobium sp.]|nr:aldehyde dehydrogenase family protein [Bradyrhizobium sp.]